MLKPKKLTGFEFFADEDNRVFVDHISKGNLRTYRAESNDVFNCIKLANFGGEFEEEYSERKLKDIFEHNVLFAKTAKLRRSVAKRYFRDDDALFINQVDRVLRIDEAGITEISISDYDLRFEYNEKRLALPDISDDACLKDFKKFRKFLPPMDQGDRLLIMTHMVNSCLVLAENPVLAFIGPPNSAKSSIASLVQRIVDPSVMHRARQPDTEEDLATEIASSHLIVIDNVGSFSKKMQDSLCLAATGGSFTRTRKYKDTEVLLIKLNAPIVFTAISNPCTHEDLLSRLVTIRLTLLKNCRSESAWKKTLDAEFDKMYGGFVCLLWQVLLELDTITLDKSKFRMTDFYRAGIAVERVLDLEAGAFRKAYQKNLAIGHHSVLAESKIVEPLLQYLRSHKNKSVIVTYATLLKKLNIYAGKEVAANPRAFSTELTKVIEALRIVHRISIKDLGHYRNGNRIKITKLKRKKK